MTHGCFGSEFYHPPFPKEKLNKTLVSYSDNGGVSWTSLGFYPSNVWRGGIVPLSPDLLVLQDGSHVAFGHQVNQGDWDFGDPVQIKEVTDKQAYTNMGGAYVSEKHMAPPVMSRVPGSSTKVLVTFPDKVNNGPNERGIGHRVFLYDTQTQTVDEIAPEKAERCRHAIH